MENKNKFLAFLASTAGKVIITIIGMVVIYGIMMAALQSDSTVVLSIALLICGYFGWRALNKITPNMFLWMSIGAWLVYYVVKGVLSVLIGAFVAPFQIAKMVAEFVNKQLNA